MSGFAALNGEPDGPPLLPPLALADGVAGLATAFAILAALRAREQTGRGQVVDTSLVEPLMTLLGPQLTAYDLLGELQPRTGNRSSHNAPRNVYRTADGAWVAVSASADSIAARVLRLVGRPDLVEQPWFATGSGRAAHVDEIDAAVAAWIAARDRDEVLAAFEAAEAAIAPIYDARDILADPQLDAIGAIPSVDDAELGPIKMSNVISRLSETPGEVRHAGGRHGEDTARCWRARRRGRRSSSGCARRGSCDGPAADVAVRAGRSPRSRREGDRVRRARGDRRPRRRRRARGEGRGARELSDAARPAAREAGLRARQRRRPSRSRGGRGPRDRRRPRAEGCAARSDVPRSDLPVHCLIESAAGVEAAYAIATTPGVAGISLGEADLRSETGALEAGLDWARGRDGQRRCRRRPAASAAVGLPAPARRRGARALVQARPRARASRPHGDPPEQLPIIEQAYLPTQEEAARAAKIVARRKETETGAFALADGHFVDAAIVRAAAQTVALVERYGAREG